MPGSKNIKKTGQETFLQDGEPLSVSLLSFWQWSGSDLVGNAQRGKLAEYIVANALECADGVRQEWDAYDIKTEDGILIEVKSAAYLQSWHQDKFSSIIFGIRPTISWDAATNTWSEQRSRLADVYVFCVLKHKDKGTIEPLNLDQWDFYVLPTGVLDKKLGEQKTISLSSLLRLEPVLTDYSGIRNSIDTIINREGKKT